MEYLDLGAFFSAKQYDQDMLFTPKRVPWATLVAASGAFLIMGLPASMYYYLSVLKKRAQQSSVLKAHIEELKTRCYQTRHVKQESAQGTALATYLSVVAETVPADVRLEEIAFQLNQEMRITGSARSLPSLTLFLKRLSYKEVLGNYTVTEIKREKYTNKHSLTFVITLSGTYGKN
jgi:Tfp pilus assembly protein PilN